MTWSNRPSNVTCCLKLGWFKQPPTEHSKLDVRLQLRCWRRAKTKRCFSAGFKVKGALKGAWEFWLAHLSWTKKLNDWSKVGSPFFLKFFGRFKGTKKFPLILLSVPMRRACRCFLFFLFWSCKKIQAQTWLVRAIPLEVWNGLARGF